MKSSPYLFFNGNCEEAFEFYGKTIGSKPELMKVAGSPAEAHYPAGWGDKVLHAHLPIGQNHFILGSDGPGYKTPQGMRVVLHVDSPADAERIFKAFSQSGKVDMPLDKTFFAKSFGMLTDRFDIPWMIITEERA